MRRKQLLAFVILCALLSGCETPKPPIGFSVTSTSTASPTVTETATKVPTATKFITSTTTNTPTLIPSPTETSTITPTPTPVPYFYDAFSNLSWHSIEEWYIVRCGNYISLKTTGVLGFRVNEMDPNIGYCIIRPKASISRANTFRI
jgi:hypothetical protein